MGLAEDGPNFDRLDMQLDICGERAIHFPNKTQLKDAVFRLNVTPRDNAFLILGPEEMTYLQCKGNSRDGFELQYQKGSLTRHYRARNESFEAEDILLRFVSYAAGNPSWKDGIDWERVEI